MKWSKEKDEVGYMHFLPVNKDYSLKVEKSRGGDYFISLVTFSEGDCIDSDVVYAGSLAVAKKKAEDLLSSGKWEELI